MSIITLASVKEWLEITDASRDVKLTTIQEAVEDAITDFCECEFVPTPVLKELHDGARTDTLIPENFPIISVQELRTQVDVDGTGGDVIPADQYAVLDDSLVLVDGRMFSKGRIMIGLDYTHGYTEVPKTISFAIKLGVEAWLRRYDKKMLATMPMTSRTKERESQSFGGGSGKSGTTWDEKSGLPNEVTAMIAKYRWLEIPGGNTAIRNR